MTFNQAVLESGEYVYKILNTANGFSYVGASMDFNTRIRGHFSALRRGKHENERMQEDFNKYGENVFDILIINTNGEDDDLRDLLEAEKYQIRNTRKLYNKSTIGRPSNVYKRRCEIRKNGYRRKRLKNKNKQQ